MDEAEDEAEVEVVDPGAPYPAHWEADVVLRDGATAHLRPIAPRDAKGLQEFHDEQSSESVYMRFFAPMPHLSDRDAERFARVDHHDRVAFVVTVGDKIAGIGRYDTLSEGVAEVAFNIADVHQGRGLGSVLLEHLAAAARETGIHTFHAEVLPQNRKMVSVFTDAGYEVRSHFDDGVISLEFAVEETERSLAVMEAREHRAEALSMQHLFTPASVAIIGPSRSPGTVGHRLLADLLEGGYTGRLHVVHRKADSVLGVPAVRRITHLKERIDLAVVAVPAEEVVGVVRDCARAGVRGLVVVSSGFAESGPEGAERQRKVVALARANGMRVVGPNSWGVINAADDVRLNVSLVPEMLNSGHLGLFSQSGGLSVAVLDAMSRRGLGLSTFLSAGNRADVSGNDCMQYWEEDEATTVVGLYLESFGNPRKFSRIARRLARQKPVIVVKSGSSGVGLPPGHEVRPSIAPREAIDSMLRQSGCIRVATIPQMLDVAQLLLHQPLPRGPRVGVVGNSDALGTLIADACASWQLEVVHMPLALHPQAGPEEFRKALKAAFTHPDVDAVVAAFIPPIATQADDVARVLSDVAGRSQIPLVACFLGTRGIAPALARGRRVVPSYPTPEEAVRALARATRYAAWRERDPGHRVEPAGIHLDAARKLVTTWLADLDRPEAGSLDVPGWDGVLDPARVTQLLAAFGVRVWPETVVRDPEEAVEAATRIGYPVVLKTTEPHLRHRVDLGGVRLDIADDDELRADVHQMQRSAGTAGSTMVVQAMAPTGVACVVRTAEDPLFGPVVSFGLGGDASELLGDVAHRIPPLTDVDVADLVRSVRAAPKLFGHRGATPVDVRALEDLIARISVLADELPEVADLELNPVVVSENGLAVLNAYVRLARPALRADAGRRELPGMTGWDHA
ncbi:GNAT family N-acetyltransferase [Spongisporangium articulatum]|uniref:GNAT family N-acetyltransferase n=1 Tax=Spongisporangium articulatum TaxID=3362603 RepID=A0ABW8AS90_9ACTN